MKVVYITSGETRSGKSAFALALARRAARAGVAAGYWKPVSAEGSADEDVAFAGKALDLREPVDVLAPIAPPPSNGTGDDGPPLRRLAENLESIAAGKGLLVVEGAQALAVGRAQGLGPAEILALLAHRGEGIGAEVQVVHVARYRGGQLGEEVAAVKALFGNALAGVLINAVPPAHQWWVSERLLPRLEARGIPLLGVLPQVNALAALTVRELASHLGAAVLASADAAAMDQLIESVMFGAMSAEDGRGYFARRENKLVVTRGDRPDVHLAALNTSTRCLLLAGGYPSYPFVLDRAEELGVPVISVGAKVHEVVERLDELLAGARPLSLEKLGRFDSLFEKQVGWGSVFETLGLRRVL